MTRRDELEAGLSVVRRRIEAACSDAGRDARDVHLIVVTKTFPAGDLRLLAELGVTDIGENKHQEAARKHAACADLPLRWHFVGALQTNKAAAVAEYAHVVHSVDRPKLVHALGRAAERAERPMRCLLQVNLDDDRVDASAGRRRAGADPRDVAALADELAGRRMLELAGVMGLAPPGQDPAPAFTRLVAVGAEIRARYPDATMVSAGMSGDLETAVRCGATHVRVGSAVLGERPPLR
ncbi:MAG: YggS family pyridoxal phosphate-dependent enzyme [Nocardioidaceae bacterium]